MESRCMSRPSAGRSVNSDAMMNNHLPYKTECDYQVASGVGFSIRLWEKRCSSRLPT
jgi:hypothetical protein